METIILGWYVLVETRSVLLLTLFAALQHIGTLLSPMFGVMGDRIGHRNMLCLMRGFYAMLAAGLGTLAVLGMLTPTFALISAGLLGLVRPSDIGVRAALVADTMPATQLVGAMGIQRTTQDSAKIVGALTGAGLMAALGIAPAYVCVTALYVISVLLTLKAGSARSKAPPAARVGAQPSPWRDLREGLGYVRRTPHLLGAMCLAFMLNCTSFPLQNGLLPYVAKDIYGTDQTGLGYMVAGASAGALLGSVVLTRYGRFVRPARMMIICSVLWYSMLFAFANVTVHALGVFVLFLAGLMQSLGQVPMAAMILRTTNEQFRGRVMGIRMLAIYGNMPGLLLAGPLIERIGYPATAMLYCSVGIAVISIIAARWRSHLWRGDAIANRR